MTAPKLSSRERVIDLLAFLMSLLPYRIKRVFKMSIDLSLGFGGGGFDCENEVKTIKQILGYRTEITALDIGANRGDWATAFLKVFRHSKVICFEPDPLSKQYFQVLLDRFPSLELNNIALAERNGNAILYTRDEVWGGASIVSRVRNGFNRKLNVELSTLDSFIDSRELFPDVIKIDVEGAEMLVLQGAINTLSRVSIVQFEFSDLQMASKLYFKDFFDFFTSAGFRLGRITPSGIAWINVYDPLEEYFRTTNFIAHNLRTARP